LDTYLLEINEIPLLNAEQEKELARRIADGDSEARNLMVRANLRLVVNIARKYQGKGLSLQDLIAEGNLGLLRAVEGFDPDRNTRFSTYACFWIKQSMRRTLINTAKTVRLPAYVVELVSKWRRANITLQEKLGRVPTEEEIARKLHLSKKKVHLVKVALRIANAAQQPEEDEESRSLNETLMDTRSMPPDLELIEADRLRQMTELLNKMDHRQATVLRHRFGLDGIDPKTLNEVGEHLGLTRERVRQIEKEALNKLWESMRA
jgi:RNA polymerase primary sigma factor